MLTADRPILVLVRTPHRVAARLPGTPCSSSSSNSISVRAKSFAAARRRLAARPDWVRSSQPRHHTCLTIGDVAPAVTTRRRCFLWVRSVQWFHGCEPGSNLVQCKSVGAAHRSPARNATSKPARRVCWSGTGMLRRGVVSFLAQHICGKDRRDISTTDTITKDVGNQCDYA